MASSMRGKNCRPSTSNSKRLPERQGNKYLLSAFDFMSRRGLESSPCFLPEKEKDFRFAVFLKSVNFSAYGLARRYCLGRAISALSQHAASGMQRQACSRGLADFRQPLHRLRDRGLRIVVVLELTAEGFVVGGHVGMAVTGEIEEYGLACAGLLAGERLVDRGAQRMAGFGRRDDALGAREGDARFESRKLRHRDGLDQPFVAELRYQRRVAVIAQPARVNARRHEVVAERVHLHQRRQADRIAEVIGVFSLRQGRAGRRLDRDEAHFLAGGPVGRQWESHAAEL